MIAECLSRFKYIVLYLYMQHDKLTASSSTGRETDDRIHSLDIPLHSQLSTRQDEIQGRLRYQRFINLYKVCDLDKYICPYTYERTYTWQEKKGKEKGQRGGIKY